MSNVGVAGLVKNFCLHKVFPETQNENVLLVEYKSKHMFKARTVDPKSTKQKIFITWSTEGNACQICLRKISLQEHVCVHIEEGPILGKEPEISYICFDELSWRFSVLFFPEEETVQRIVLQRVLPLLEKDEH